MNTEWTGPYGQNVPATVCAALLLVAAVATAVLAQGRKEVDQQKRKAIYAEVQKILAVDLPYINLWYFDNVIVYTPRVKGLTLNPSGNYDFLRTAELQP